MAGAVDHNHLRSRNALVERLADGERNQQIVASPDDQRGSVHFPQFPAPVQRPRIPVWVGGVLPAARPIARAARWDGMVPIRFAERALVRPSAADMADVGAKIAAARAAAGAPPSLTWWCGRR